MSPDNKTWITKQQQYFQKSIEFSSSSFSDLVPILSLLVLLIYEKYHNKNPFSKLVAYVREIWYCNHAFTVQSRMGIENDLSVTSHLLSLLLKINLVFSPRKTYFSESSLKHFLIPQGGQNKHGHTPRKSGEVDSSSTKLQWNLGESHVGDKK